MNVLLLSRYGPLGASSRLRFYQYLPYLASRGIEVTVRPLLEDAYVRALYGGRASRRRSALRAYPSRVRETLTGRRYDLLWIEKEILPMVPSVLEGLVRPHRVPCVVDLDDAVFHLYDRHPSPLVRRLLGGKIDAVMRGAAVVVAGSEYIAHRARAAGARRVARLPTVIDLGRYPESPRSRAERPFTVGWIGSPITSRFLDLVETPLGRLARGGRLRLRAIGAAPVELDGVEVERPAWSAETEVDLLAGCDVGIMPLEDAPFERGKCGYKLVQYMGCHLPVVASPVGANRELVEAGKNGYLPDSAEGWVEALESLRGSADLRDRMGRAGRRKVEAEYCLDVAAPRLEELLRSAAREGG